MREERGQEEVGTEGGRWSGKNALERGRSEQGGSERESFGLECVCHRPKQIDDSRGERC